MEFESAVLITFADEIMLTPNVHVEYVCGVRRNVPLTAGSDRKNVTMITVFYHWEDIGSIFIRDDRLLVETGAESNSDSFLLSDPDCYKKAIRHIKDEILLLVEKGYFRDQDPDYDPNADEDPFVF